MLVLSRKIGQTIEIGEGISVQVIRIEGDRVRIGISAPKNVRILRGELPAANEFADELMHDLTAGGDHGLFPVIATPQGV